MDKSELYVDFEGNYVVHHPKINKIRQYLSNSVSINNYHAEAWKLFLKIWNKANSDYIGSYRNKFISYLDHGGTKQLMDIIEPKLDYNIWLPIDSAMAHINREPSYGHIRK